MLRNQAWESQVASIDPYSRRVFRRDFRAYLRQRWRPFTVVAAAGLVMAAALSAWLWFTIPHGSVLLYVLGAMHACLVGFVLLLPRLTFVMADPKAIHHMRGAWGEDNTRDVLKKARKRRSTWGSVDGIATQDGDIDHMVVTREGGLVAIDSKWRNTFTTEWLQKDAAAAAGASRRAESVLRSEGLLRRETAARHRAAASTISVTPLVVIWGGAQDDVPDGAQIEGVPFVPGNGLLAWLEARQHDPVDEEVAESILNALNEFRSRVRPELSAARSR